MVAEEQAARAARLRALREAAQIDTPDQTAAPPADGDAEPVLKFRNYVVKDDQISHEKQAIANPPKYEAPAAAPDLDAEGEVRLGDTRHTYAVLCIKAIEPFLCRNCCCMWHPRSQIGI